MNAAKIFLAKCPQFTLHIAIMMNVYKLPNVLRGNIIKLQSYSKNLTHICQCNWFDHLQVEGSWNQVRFPGQVCHA